MVTRPRNLQQADPYFDSVVFLAPLSGEDGDTTASDLSNSGHVLTFNGNAQLDGDIRKFGFTSALFDGTGDGITAPDSTDFDLGSGQFTVEADVRFNGDPGTTAMAIVGHYTPTGDERAWSMNLGNTVSNQFRFSWSTNGAVGGYAEETAAWNPVGDQWYHLAVARDDTNLYMFIDGVLIKTVANSATFHSATAPLSIGMWSDGNQPLDGWIENVRITKGVCRYTAAFTPPERAYSTVKGQTPVTNGLVLNLDPSSPASYPGSGTTLFDLSPYSNDATLSGSPTITNGIIQLDGVDDYIEVSNINLSNTDGVTVDFWCKLDTYIETDSIADNIMLEFTSNYNSFTTGFILTTADDSVPGYNNTFPISVNVKGNAGYNAHGFSKTLVNDLAWHHWSVIFDKSVDGTTPQEGRLYIDNIERSVAVLPSGNRLDNTNNFGSASFRISGRSGAPASRNIEGDIGSFRIYDRVLTDGEVRQNFEAHRNRYGV